MTHRLALRAATALGFAAALSIARVAAAQDAAAAEALFKQGRELMTKGDLEAACPKLAESERLDPSSGTALNLALCHKKQGKTATAWADYKNAARVAQRQGNAARVEEANREAAALEGSLAYLTIEVASPVAGLEVLRDDVKLEAGSFGAKLPIDPGKHVVLAKAPAYKAATLDVSIDGPRAAQVLHVPALEKDAAAGEPAGPVVSVAAPPADAPPPKSPGALPWIVGGSGVVVLGVGAVLGGVALSSYSTAKSACPTDNTCPSSSVDRASSANTEANISNVAIGVGAAAVVTGVVLYVVMRKPATASAPAVTGAGMRFTPRLGRSLEVTF